MKRRIFVRDLLTWPAVSATVAAGQAPPPTTSPTQQPQPKPNTPAQQESRQPQSIPKLAVTASDLTAEAAPQFFTDVQFATLEKLSQVLMPPLKNNPGAWEAHAPEFLDFLLGVSPAERQKSYQFGLDQLELQAKNQYQQSFGSLSETQVGLLVKPLLVVRPWPEDLPSDPLQSFMAQVHEDLRTATMNSRQWAAASEKSGRLFSRGFRGSGYYWSPIDPIS